MLFGLTLLTTCATGAQFALAFQSGRPPFADGGLLAVFDVWSRPSLLFAGVPFSLSLLAILMAHEMGHYVACRHYRVEASLPYFLPAPTLIGTFGAFIRIRSPIYSRRVLFDIGVAGPLAGFVALLPVLAVGVAHSKVVPGIVRQGDLIFGTPLAVRALEAVVFPGVPVSDVYLHPMARAAWVGLLATALNLLPVGQLDGGHILYALAGKWQDRLSKIALAALVPLGFDYWPWWVFAAVLFLFGRRHFHIQDDRGLCSTRRWLAVASLAVFVLSFLPVPVMPGGGW